MRIYWPKSYTLLQKRIMYFSSSTTSLMTKSRLKMKNCVCAKVNFKSLQIYSVTVAVRQIRVFVCLSRRFGPIHVMLSFGKLQSQITGLRRDVKACSAIIVCPNLPAMSQLIRYVQVQRSDSFVLCLPRSLIQILDPSLSAPCPLTISGSQPCCIPHPKPDFSCSSSKLKNWARLYSFFDTGLCRFGGTTFLCCLLFGIILFSPLKFLLPWRRLCLICGMIFFRVISVKVLILP